MNKKEKLEACKKYFEELVDSLAGRYTLVESCNADISKYLVPNGTEDLITYSSKPRKSFRISDHWNWFANINKCSNEKYIQCWSVDIPYPYPRKAPENPSKPRYAIQVSVVGEDGRYHALFGEVYNRKTKTWEWLNGTIQDALDFI